MKRQGFIVLCLILAAGLMALAQNPPLYFPQVANGDFGSGSFKTTLILNNTGAVSANVTVQVTRSDGSAFSIFPGLGTAPINIPPGNSRVYQSDGTGELAAGAATLTSDNPIGATIIFSQFDSDGNVLTEAGVTSAQAMPAFTIPVDLSSGYNTGVAFFKPGTGSANLSLRLFDEDGSERGGRPAFSLGANGHRAAYVPELFTGLTGFSRGSLSISTDAPIAGVALRQGSGPVPVITTLPVATAGTVFNFPQVANGSYPGGSFRTTLILNNAGTAAATANVRVNRDGDIAFPIFPGLESGSVTLAPGSTRFYQSNGQGELGAGAAAITSNNPVIAAIIFSQYDASGSLITEAGVANATAMQSFTIPVDLRSSFNTGVALFKPGSGTANVTLRLFELGGAARGESPLTMGPNGHRPAYVPDLFPGLTGFTQGSLTITSSSNVAAVALRQGSGPVPVITTLPVIPGAFLPDSGPVTFAGSFDGPFMVGDSSASSGTLTFTLRQEGSNLSGRLAHVFEEGGCIRASEFTSATITGNRFTATARALDGSGIETNLVGTLLGSGDNATLTGTFTTRGCGTTSVSGRFSHRRIPGRCPPEQVTNYLGAVWNTESMDLLILTMTARFSGRDFVVTRISVQTPIGGITGTATGRLNEACDLVENLEVSLATPVGPLTLRGELNVTPDGRIIFGGLRTGPADPVTLAGSLWVRGL